MLYKFRKSRLPLLAPIITLALVCTLSFLAILSVTLKAGGDDDAYITYTFARNLAEGEGFVYFEGGPRVYGSTTVTYTLLLALVHSVGLPIPMTSIVLGAFFWVVSLIPLYICIKKLCSFSSGASSEVIPLVGVAVAGLCTVPAVESLGLETGLYCLLAFSSFALYATGRVGLSLFMAALTALTRLDGLLVGVILGAHLLVSSGSWKEGLKTALRRGWPALFLLFTSTLSLWWYFGNPLPQTLLAKTSFPETVSGQFALHLYRELFGAGLGGLSFYTTGGFATAAIFFASRVPGFRSPAFALCAWIVLYPLMFRVAGIPSHPWYYVPILPVLLALAAVGAYQVGAYQLRVLWHTSELRERATSWYMRPLLLSAILLLVLSYDAERWQAHFEVSPWGEGITEGDARYRLAQAITEDIRERGVENPDVMAYEIGHLGWQVGEIPGARIHDILGLTSPEAYGEKGEWKPENLLRSDPEYIMIHRSPNYPPVRWLYRSGILENRYERIALVEASPEDPYLAFVRTEPLERFPHSQNRLPSTQQPNLGWMP
jgi:hypothetical protein